MSFYISFTFEEIPMPDNIPNNPTPTVSDADYETLAHDPYTDYSEYHQNFKNTAEYQNLSDADKKSYDGMDPADQKTFEFKTFNKEHPSSAQQHRTEKISHDTTLPRGIPNGV
jgi:hypothetical protein